MASLSSLSIDQIAAALAQKGMRRDLSVIYAGYFCEFRKAIDNIEKEGIIVNHPRTGNPMENPYLAIRDRAAGRLESLGSEIVAFLWSV